MIAESRDGDPNNVVMAGAHLDSVLRGPGINDNGSGSAAILETAIQMAKVKPRNKLRFAWWGAEEAGLVGSTAYVAGLSAEEKAKIALYLNFDMVGSPNHVFFIYDGDDSDGVGAGPGPGGSAEIEKVFEGFFAARGVPFKGTDFSGRSDYGPFIADGIPAGGLFTGAEGVKTADEAALWGGTAGQPYDPCYHLALRHLRQQQRHRARRQQRRDRLRGAAVRDEHRGRQRPARQGQLQDAAGRGGRPPRQRDALNSVPTTKRPRPHRGRYSYCACHAGYATRCDVSPATAQVLAELCRHITRPALANERVRTNASGRLRWCQGQLCGGSFVSVSIAGWVACRPTRTAADWLHDSCNWAARKRVLATGSYRCVPVLRPPAAAENGASTG